MWPATTVLSFKAFPSGERFDFHTARYDADTDRLHLSFGPETAVSAAVTPEGHIVHFAQPDGYFCGLVLTNVHQRLEDHGRVEVTLSPLDFVCLTISDIAHALTSPVERRTGRFTRDGGSRQHGDGAAGSWDGPAALSSA